MNTTTKRHPRTLNEAFGPYNDRGTFYDQDPMPAADRIVIAASCAALLAILGMAVAGWL
jgi:hypothetical protein